MKNLKSILILFAVLIAFAVQAQIPKGTTIVLKPDTAGTIIGVDNAVTTGGNVHTFKSGFIQGGPYVWSVETYVTITGTHATDSTRVEVWGSMDGINYSRLKYEDVGRPTLTGAAFAAPTNNFYYGVAVTGYTTGVRLSSAGTGPAGWHWHPTALLSYRFIAVKIYQLKALSICTVNKCNLHLFTK